MNNNKRIAYNTVVLYIKIVLSAIIGLYTSRVVLQALGADNYGLYTVVGGVVSFLNIIGVTMITATNRFISVELGKEDKGDVNRIFNTVLIIHFLLAVLLLIIGETIGLYYVNNFLNVADGQMLDARFVLHLSIITTVFSILAVPYQGLIIAREKFVFSSFVEILSLIVKLGLVIILLGGSGNRLRLFTIIMLVITLLTLILSVLYCYIKDSNILKFNLNKNKSDYWEVFGFAGWSLFGASAYIGKEQGASMIINYFFGTVLNASFGLASQINRYAMMFTKGLSQAAAPQIMKSYGANDMERSLYLVYSISKIATLIMLIITVPLLLCMDKILELWLVEVPEYTTIFAQFMLINTLVTMLGAGFDPCIQSTGKIKVNELYTSIIYISVLPIIYVMYKLGMPPYMNVVVLPFLSIAIRVVQMCLLKQMTVFNVVKFINYAIIPSILTFVFSVIPLYFIRDFFQTGLMNCLLFLSLSILWVMVCIVILGISKSERLALKRLIKKTEL